MSAKKSPPKPVSQQSKFIEAARELGCDEDGAKFNEALAKVARHKPVEDKPASPVNQEQRRTTDKTK